MDVGFDAFLRLTETSESDSDAVQIDLSSTVSRPRRPKRMRVSPDPLDRLFSSSSSTEPSGSSSGAAEAGGSVDAVGLRAPKVLSFRSMYTGLYEHEMALKKKRKTRASVPRKHEYQLARYSRMIQSSGDKRLRSLRTALEQLDHMGFMRSSHQRQFHEAFIAACLPQIYGADLDKNLVRILRENNMEEIRCEIMVCCPRRWGKTMAVALYAAAYLWSQPDAEVLIYSIAKRTSSMLMAKVYNMIVKLAGGTHVVKTHNQEDLEIVNVYGQTSVCHSYPAASKISISCAHTPQGGRVGAPCCRQDARACWAANLNTAEHITQWTRVRRNAMQHRTEVRVVP